MRCKRNDKIAGFVQFLLANWNVFKRLVNRIRIRCFSAYFRRRFNRSASGVLTEYLPVLRVRHYLWLTDTAPGLMNLLNVCGRPHTPNRVFDFKHLSRKPLLRIRPETQYSNPNRVVPTDGIAPLWSSRGVRRVKSPQARRRFSRVRWQSVDQLIPDNFPSSVGSKDPDNNNAHCRCCDRDIIVLRENTERRTKKKKKNRIL